MNSTKHTPGPLSPIRHTERDFDPPTRYDDWLRRDVERVACDDCDKECTVGTPYGPPTVRGDGDAQMRRCWECEKRWCEASARLHNATPDLLAACEDAEADMSANGRVTPIVLGRMRDAIKKATGAP